MDAHLETEDVDASGSWSLASKVISGLIVVVLGFIIVSMFSIAIDFNSGWTDKQVDQLSAGSTGEFNTQKPIVKEEKKVDEPVREDSSNTGNVQEDTLEDSVLDEGEDLQEPVEEGTVDDFEIVGEENLDNGVLNDVEGCLRRKVTGETCDIVFRRNDIAEYCDEFLFDDNTAKLADPCFAIAAAMNNNEDYCYDVENEALLNKCLERFA